MQQNLSPGGSVQTITNDLRQIKLLPFCIYIFMHCNPCMLFLLCLSVPSQYYLEANCVTAVLQVLQLFCYSLRQMLVMNLVKFYQLAF